LNLGGTGISTPENFSYRSSSSYTTSGDIFYCSGSRQLNHSSFTCFWTQKRVRKRYQRCSCCCSYRYQIFHSLSLIVVLDFSLSVIGRFFVQYESTCLWNQLPESPHLYLILISLPDSCLYARVSLSFSSSQVTTHTVHHPFSLSRQS